MMSASPDPLAQWLEQMTHNHPVVGSSPTGRTNRFTMFKEIQNPSPYMYPGLNYRAKWEIQLERTFDSHQLDIVCEAVAEAHNIQATQLMSVTRYQPYPDARKVFVHLCRKALFFREITCKRLGMYLNRDHSTITVAEQRAEQLYEVDSEFRGKYNDSLQLSRERLKLNGYQFIGSENLTNYGTRDKRIPSLESINCREGSSYTATTVGELNRQV